MSTTLTQVQTPLGCTIQCCTPQLSPDHELLPAPTCPIQPSNLVFKQVGSVITAYFSVSLHNTNKLYLSQAGFINDKPGTIYLEVYYNGQVNMGNVYKTTVTATIQGNENVLYTTLCVYLKNTNGVGTCATPLYIFPPSLDSVPPSSGTISAGTSTSIQPICEDTIASSI
jgi:hypothetical protein